MTNTPFIQTGEAEAILPLPDNRRPITVIAGHPRLRYADGTFFGTMEIVFLRHGSAWR